MKNTRDDLITRYAAGERRFRGLDLDGETMDLRNSNLAGSDFSYSFLVADFRGANLEGCIFEHANVKTCDFRGANLRNSSFRNAAIDGAEFVGADMTGANFEGASTQGHVFNSGETPDAL